MAEKKLLLGDEAIALGAIHAGISGVYAYPGTPSTEITEFIQNNPLAKERKLHSTWCTNEKTAISSTICAAAFFLQLIFHHPFRFSAPIIAQES